MQRISKPAILIALLALLISISPRILVGTLQYERALELRYEDLFIIVILYLGLLAIFNDRKIITNTYITKVLFVYLALGLFSTIIGIFMEWITLQRALFFYSKEIQYFLIFLIVINSINTSEEIGFITWVLVFLGFINNIYTFFQLVSQNFSGGYGIALIGETSPFQTGGYMVIIFFLSVSLYISGKVNSLFLKAFLIINSAGCLISLMFSVSRSFVIGLGFSLVLFLSIKSGKRLLFISITIIAILAVFYISPLVYESLPIGMPVEDRLTNVYHIQRSIDIRIELDYRPFLSAAMNNPISGLGKSITGTRGLPVEAHNHYLRVFVEMGIIGISVFIYLIFCILKMSYAALKNPGESYERAIALACFLITLSLLIASLVQDAFSPVKMSEIYWIIVGLTAVSYGRLGIREHLKRTD